MIEIEITKNKSVIVDLEDFERLNRYKWYYASGGYAARSKHIYKSKGKYGSKKLYMHREILGVSGVQVIDHINHNTLDNRKCNLRVVNQSMNMRNRMSCAGSTSKYVGVHFHKLTGKWRAQIKIGSKIKSLGLYRTQKEAHEARQKYIEEKNLEGFRR